MFSTRPLISARSAIFAELTAMRDPGGE